MSVKVPPRSIQNCQPPIDAPRRYDPPHTGRAPGAKERDFRFRSRSRISGTCGRACVVDAYLAKDIGDDVFSAEPVLDP